MDKTSFPETIADSKVILRKHALEIAPLMFSYVDRDRERLRQFLPWVDATKTVEDEAKYIQTTHEKWDKGELFDYGMYEPDSNTYLGNVGVHSIRWEDDCCELGYWIVGEFEGKGIVSQAIRLLEEVCFQKKFHRIEIRCSSLNQRSAIIPFRLGYELEGVLAQNVMEMGQRRNTLVFSKLNPETAIPKKPHGWPTSINDDGVFEPFAAKSVPWEEFKDKQGETSRFRVLSRHGGGSHVGVAIDELGPGKYSNQFHYHFNEEEHVYILKGEATLYLGEKSHIMKEGDYCCFPAGQRAGHHLYNHTKTKCYFLTIGENRPADLYAYPQTGEVRFKTPR